mmetsp:Transcript_9096/g.16555  ORF Transcript_9096/g.16555 Transcript_9096/m.16555 type:complete len:581 (-) Transcript_9096:72-1814(-)
MMNFPVAVVDAVHVGWLSKTVGEDGRDRFVLGVASGHGWLGRKLLPHGFAHALEELVGRIGHPARLTLLVRELERHPVSHVGLDRRRQLGVRVVNLHGRRDVRVHPHPRGPRRGRFLHLSEHPPQIHHTHAGREAELLGERHVRLLREHSAGLVARICAQLGFAVRDAAHSLPDGRRKLRVDAREPLHRDLAVRSPQLPDSFGEHDRWIEERADIPRAERLLGRCGGIFEGGRRHVEAHEAAAREHASGRPGCEQRTLRLGYKNVVGHERVFMPVHEILQLLSVVRRVVELGRRRRHAAHHDLHVDRQTVRTHRVHDGFDGVDRRKHVALVLGHTLGGHAIVVHDRLERLAVPRAACRVVGLRDAVVGVDEHGGLVLAHHLVAEDERRGAILLGHVVHARVIHDVLHLVGRLVTVLDVVRVIGHRRDGAEVTQVVRELILVLLRPVVHALVRDGVLVSDFVRKPLHELGELRNHGLLVLPEIRILWIDQHRHAVLLLGILERALQVVHGIVRRVVRRAAWVDVVEDRQEGRARGEVAGEIGDVKVVIRVGVLLDPAEDLILESGHVVDSAEVFGHEEDNG